MQGRVRVTVWSWVIHFVYDSPHKDRNVTVCPVTKDNEKERESEEVKLQDKSIQAERLESEDSRGSRAGIPGRPVTFGLA